jgi:hypothetical protein
MTRQAVCQADDLFFGLFQVAIQTPAHIHLHCRLGDGHAAYITMASFAVDACPQVDLVTEVDEVRLLVYAVP